MTRTVVILLFSLFVAVVQAQTLSGTVTDGSTGELLPYASIYVQQTGGGATTNTEGRYEVRLAPGRNTVVFQFLGYQTPSRGGAEQSGYPRRGAECRGARSQRGGGGKRGGRRELQRHPPGHRQGRTTTAIRSIATPPMSI